MLHVSHARWRIYSRLMSSWSGTVLLCLRSRLYDMFGLVLGLVLCGSVLFQNLTGGGLHQEWP